LSIDDIDWSCVLDVQRELCARGSMRSVPLPDLLIAAVSEGHRVTVLHDDSDDDAIAATTGQPTRWIVPRGSVD